MLNHCVFMGRLTADPELKTTNSGKYVTSFSIAVQRNYSKDATDFIQCVGWEKTAEFICKYYSRGMLICVEGNMQSRNYQTKNGDKRTAYELNIEQTHFCEKKQSATDDTSAITYEDMPVSSDDLPF